MGKNQRKRKKSGKVGIIGIIAVVLFMAVVLFSQISDKEKELQELEVKQEQLEKRLEEEKTRGEQLEEKRIYVKTKKYVEEIAKQLGLVYPNEVIYKPNN